MPASVLDSLSGNRILAALSAEEKARIALHVQPVSFTSASTLLASGGLLDAVYFPTTSILALAHAPADTFHAAVSLTGNDGFICFGAVLGSRLSMHEAKVVAAGNALRMDRDLLLEEFLRGGLLQRLALRFLHALVTQISTASVCERLHTIEQRAIRWLLTGDDLAKPAGGVGPADLAWTQELLANLMGVRREGVSLAASRLRKAGLIEYQPGRIRILDRAALEARSCQCYREVQAEYLRYFDDVEQHSQASP